MPHLQFEVNKQLKKDIKERFIDFVEKNFSEIMQTGTDHIAISIREMSFNNLSLGRAKNNEHICLMNLDIRAGRTNSQKKRLIKSLICGANNILGIKKKNQYVTITNHVGEEFNFFEKSLSNWVKNDDPAKNKKKS